MGIVQIFEGIPFPDFYKVVRVDENGKRSQRLFYGENGYNDMRRHVEDFGVRSMYAGY
jgi:hypothetical protein